jgi:hypothetical protein
MHFVCGRKVLDDCRCATIARAGKVTVAQILLLRGCAIVFRPALCGSAAVAKP